MKECFEYFVVANSFAAPFFSDRSTDFAQGETPTLALLSFAETYSHPYGLYSAAIYGSANAYHKNKPALARWLSNHAIFMQDKISGTIKGIAPGKVEINGVIHIIENPKDGTVVLEGLKA